MLSERIKELRNKRNMTQKEFAKAFDISIGAIAMWETGKRQPNYEMLKRIASYFNVSVDYLLGGERLEADAPPPPSRPGSKWIKVIGTISAGTPIEAIEDILDYEEIDAETAKTGEFFALKIKGASMEPQLFENDVVIVRQQSDVESGRIAIVLINGEDATCKKVVKHETGISLIGLNTAVYEPHFYTPEDIASLPISILGEVIEVRRKFV